MRDDLHRLADALDAAARLDHPEASADREADLATVADAARTVRALGAWVDQDAADALAWALYVHGGLSQDQVARELGYGREGGGRSVRATQVRLERAQDHRITTTAAALVAAAETGPGAPITVPAPLKVPAERHAAALAELHAAVHADAGTGATTRTRAALAAAVATWGTDAGRLLGRLAHTASLATQPTTEQP